MHRRSCGLLLCALCVSRCSAARSPIDPSTRENAKFTAHAKVGDASIDDASDPGAAERLRTGGRVDPETERLLLLYATPANAGSQRPVARPAFAGAARFSVDNSELNARGYPRSLRRAERAVVACFVAENARSPLRVRELHFDVSVDARSVARWTLDSEAFAQRAVFVQCVERALRSVRIPSVDREGFDFALGVRIEPPRAAYTPTRRQLQEWDCEHGHGRREAPQGATRDGSLRSTR
jgi:hypothetical protein